MNRISISTEERDQATFALRVAADRYTENAQICREETRSAHSTIAKRLAEQFDRQATEARTLADILDERGA